MHSFTWIYVISQNQPSPPPPPPKLQLKAPDGIILSETSTSGDKEEDKDEDQEEDANASNGDYTADPASVESWFSGKRVLQTSEETTFPVFYERETPRTVPFCPSQILKATNKNFITYFRLLLGCFQDSKLKRDQKRTCLSPLFVD